MGMYVCGMCIDEYNLHDRRIVPGALVCACEVCGDLKGDWSNKFTRWTTCIHRNVSALDQKAWVASELEAWRQHQAAQGIDIS